MGEYGANPEYEQVCEISAPLKLTPENEIVHGWGVCVAGAPGVVLGGVTTPADTVEQLTKVLIAL